MALSSGARSVFIEGFAWLCVAVAVAAGANVYFSVQRAVDEGSPPLHIAEQQHAPSKASNSGTVDLRAGPQGHFFADARLNGQAITAMVDTGASLVALTHEDARRGGIRLTDDDYRHPAQTANGIAHVAIVEISRLAIGDIQVRNVRATVHPPGMLHVSLLGMSFIQKLRRAEMRQGRLILEN